VKPNFFFIGPDKAGSTWLYEALGRHKQVYLPNAKELFFFDRFYHLGWDWYEKYFKGAGKEHKIVGEICHDYLFSPLACERIARDLPEAKLMVCLREPVERAFSAYLYMVKQGRVTTDFETAIEEKDELIDHGRYAKHLERYLRVFGSERIHVAIFDDLVSDPQRFFDEVCNFLEIERMLLPAELRKTVLPAARPRSLFWAKVIRGMGWCIRCLGLPQLVTYAKNSAFVNHLLYTPYHMDEKPKMSPKTRMDLRTIFLPEIQQLSDLVGYDFCNRWGYTSINDSANIE